MIKKIIGMKEHDLSTNPSLGQVWTPSDIALAMAKECLLLHPNAKHVLDPACGPGTFSQALHDAGANGIRFYCYDVDIRMKSATASLNQELGLKGSVYLKDYLADTSLQGRIDIAIMNPPYIRQEDIPLATKDSYHKYLSNTLNGEIDRRSNLFVLFLLKGLIDLRPRGIMCAIVYDAISQTAYGKKALKLISRHAELISHRHVSTPFQNVLVDAQVMIFRKRVKPVNHEEFSDCPADGLVSLGELLNSRRGTGLPLRKLYIAGEDDPYYEQSEPFFIKQAKLQSLIVKPDQRAYLLKNSTIGKTRVVDWLKQRAECLNINAPKLIIPGVRGPIVFNYYIRNAARHLWNAKDVAVADNFYVSTVKDDFPPEAAWLLLNSELYLRRIQSVARNQGNGLSKLQLYEYKNVRVPDWRALPDKCIVTLFNTSLALLENNANHESVRNTADQATKGIFDA